MNESDYSAFANHVVACLGPLLGRFTAMRALVVVCDKLGVPPGELSESHAMDAAEILVPMLRTLLGKQAAMSVRRQIVFPEGEP